MHLKDLKQKSPKELLTQAEELGIEDASSMRVQDLIFAIMKKVASDDQTIYGEGTIEVLQDGFGFCALPNPTIWPVPMTFMFRLHRSKNSACAPAIP